MPRLEKSALLGVVLDGLRDGGWTPLVLDDAHPFLIRAVNEARAHFNLRVFIWNCTHGGKGRDKNEYRIQVTSVTPRMYPDEITLLLGWNGDFGVLAAWDIAAHDGQMSSSPSAQVHALTLDDAQRAAFATQVKGNEIVVAFQPQYLAEYALSRDSLHKMGPRDLERINRLSTITDAEIESIADPVRRAVVRTIVTKFRSASFRDSVLNAYGHKCAFCGLQLSLLDAAHIMPVAAPGSTDGVDNGVAACKLHHYAYDSNLLSFNTDYRIEVSQARLAELEAKNLQGGLLGFRTTLAASLFLPARNQHYPNRRYIEESRRFRDWRP